MAQKYIHKENSAFRLNNWKILFKKIVSIEHL